MKIMDIIDDKYTKKGTWIKDSVLMCNKDCCGAPVSECSCDSSCKKCNCYNLKENKVVEAIPKSTMYGLVIDGEYVAKGSKADMMKMKKEKGGTVYNAPGKKVGDKAGVVKERYGMRQGVAGARSANATAINQTKRANNRAQNQGREDRIAQQQDFIKNKRRSTKIPTGLVQRQQAQAPVQQS